MSALAAVGGALVATVAQPPQEGAPLLWALAALLVVAGIVGTVVPALPGAPLVFLGLLIAAWVDRFQRVGWITLTVLGVLTVASFLLELLATRHGAQRVGASPLAAFGATVGAIVGLFFSIPGLILGPFVGAFAGEYLSRRSWKQAGRAGLGTWLGLVLGIAAKLTIVFLMLGLFVTAYVIGGWFG